MSHVLKAFLDIVQLATVLATVLAFIWGLHFIRSRYGSRSRRWQNWRGADGPTGEEQAILDDLGKIAERMERRLDTLEKILEADDPKWKERAP